MNIELNTRNNNFQTNFKIEDELSVHSLSDIDKLPNEIFFQILMNLEVKDFVKTTLVSKKWKAITIEVVDQIYLRPIIKLRNILDNQFFNNYPSFKTTIPKLKPHLNISEVLLNELRISNDIQCDIKNFLLSHFGVVDKYCITQQFQLIHIYSVIISIIVNANNPLYAAIIGKGIEKNMLYSYLSEFFKQFTQKIESDVLIEIYNLSIFIPHPTPKDLILKSICINCLKQNLFNLFLEFANKFLDSRMKDITLELCLLKSENKITDEQIVNILNAFTNQNRRDECIQFLCTELALNNNFTRAAILASHLSNEEIRATTLKMIQSEKEAQ